MHRKPRLIRNAPAVTALGPRGDLARLALLAAAAATATGSIEAASLHPVEDDHGIGLEATLLPFGHAVAGTLSDPGDVDAFRLDLAAAARVEVRTSGATDTRGRLLDASGAVIGRDDDSGPGGHNFRVVGTLEPGVHYVEVAGAAGDFWVTARLADAFDHGDNAVASTPLRLHVTGNRAGFWPDIRLGVSGRIWPSAEDIDVFRIDVPRDGTDVRVRTSGQTALRARLVDSALTELASDDGSNVRMNRLLDAGTYYVMVGADEVGAYRLLATGERTGDLCAQSVLARDDGSTPESSTLLSVGGPAAAGVIADEADVDLFRLDLVGDARVEVRTTGGTDTRGELYDSSGALIAADQGSGPGGRNFRITQELSAGIYYLAVTGAPGEYAVTARPGGAFDHADGPWTSTRLPLHETDDLARVSPDMLLGTAGRIWPKADEDVFRLDVGRDRTVVRIRTSGNTPLYAHLTHDGEALVEVASNDSSGNVHIEAHLDAGVYYLRIGGHETGAYRVLAWGYDPGFAPPDKAAFDRLVAGKSLLGLYDTYDFRAASRSFKARWDGWELLGSYAYERGACPDAGWLQLEYHYGRRCEALLSFDSANTGVATFSCVHWSDHLDTSSFRIIDSAEPAHIPDQNLADSIRRRLGKEQDPISLADMASLRSLHVSRLTDLTGLGLATGLRELGLYSVGTPSLEPLASLTKLRDLVLSNSPIADLKPLAGLTGLAKLSLSGNRISDLAPLARLSALTELRLDRNRISDLEPLAGLPKLTDLYISDNEISDLGPLADSKSLRGLHASRNRISDLKPLAGLINLGSLSISENEISDLYPLADWVSLRRLVAAHNRISDLKPLAGRSLGSLDLEGNRIEDLSPLSDVAWSPAVSLDLSDNDITDVTPLSDMTFLQLDLSHNEISDLTPLASMSAYEALGYDGSSTLLLQGNRISDVTPLAPLVSQGGFRGDDDWWGTVDLGHNAIAELPGDARWPAALDLAGNRITSPRSLTPSRFLNLEGNALTSVPRADGSSSYLNRLYLGGNEISDLASLYYDVWRIYIGVDVSLWRNPLSAWARERQLPELQSLSEEAHLVDIVGGGQLIPLLANAPALQHPNRRGVLRLVNLATEGDAWLYAPRLGDMAQPAAVVVPARWAVHIDAEDIKRGARDKRVYRELPIGSGDAALEVYSSTEIRAYGYVRTADGFLTSMHDLASSDIDGRHTVPIFNPASNTRQASLLRLINMDRKEAYVSVTGMDDAGVQGGRVQFVLPARTATVLDAGSLERGSGTGLSGSLGDGEGKWRLEVRSDGHLAVMSLLESPTGHLTNLSTSAPGHTVPLFPSASHPKRRGWIRVVNLGHETEVDIRGTDDAGNMVGPVTVPIASGHAFSFDSDDWENGNASKGLVRGVGRGTGDWRLEFASDGHILVGAYAETEDGFLSSIHDRVSPVDEPTSGCDHWRHRWDRPCRASAAALFAVSPFRPESGDGLVSSLRLLNDGDEDAMVAIWGFDERGNRAGPVDLVLAAGTARTVTARELTSGGEGLAGWLREGAGTWELLVTTFSGRVSLVNLLEDRSGRIANLSTAPYHPVADEYR